jgi:hypothetical protein
MSELGEARLLAPLLAWLKRRRQIRTRTVVVTEVPWHGRRVDVATLTTTGRTTAYELKLRNTRRAIEQAAMNKLCFDRSYIVTTVTPNDENRLLAENLGVGIITVDPSGGHRVMLESHGVIDDARIRLRLHGALLALVGSEKHVDV